MKIKEAEGFEGARYTECIPDWFSELSFVDGVCEDEYSGVVRLTGKDDNNFYTLYYSYGSCSGCDDWEYRDLSDDEIKKEISDLIIKYSPEEYKMLQERLSGNKDKS